MTTATTLIQNALETIGLLPENQPIPSWHGERGLVRLNDMLDAWATDGLYASTTADAVLTDIAGRATITIGPTGTLVWPTIPVRIEHAFIRSGTFDYPIEIIDAAAFAAINDKSQGSTYPSAAYYDGVGTITFYPVPSNGDIHLGIGSTIREFATLTTSYTLAAGARKAIALSLAEELAPGFGRELPPSVHMRAAGARRVLRRVNVRVPILRGGHCHGSVWNILNPPNADVYDGGNAGSP